MKKKPDHRTATAETPIPGGDVKAPVQPLEVDRAEEDRIDMARSRIARDFYNQAHVRNRILKALLQIIDED